MLVDLKSEFFNALPPTPQELNNIYYTYYIYIKKRIKYQRGSDFLIQKIVSQENRGSFKITLDIEFNLFFQLMKSMEKKFFFS